MMKFLAATASVLYRDFSVFEHYGVDKYMASFGLSVDNRYRGRRIGEQLLGARLLIFFMHS